MTARRGPEPVLALKKQPSQRRARATVEAIVEACARLMAARGYAAVTTNHIAAEARVGIGSLYEYFPGKDAIVAIVAERLVGRVLDRLEAAVPEVLAAPPELATLRWIERIHEILEGERGLVASFYYEVPYTNRLPAVRAIAPRLLELSRAMRRDAGVRIKLVHEGASLRLMINLVTATILQVVLQPPAEAERREILIALAERIASWARGE